MGQRAAADVEAGTVSRSSTSSIQAGVLRSSNRGIVRRPQRLSGGTLREQILRYGQERMGRDREYREAVLKKKEKKQTQERNEHS